ncbi:MAG: hypothetical protein A2X12_02555 [Bacteroidetes bacterium GWE2_29_8]|nr:MAG: hypothetical protein A2X12_02555 [Bacteroidetes bacterium GWE2_29_8]
MKLKKKVNAIPKKETGINFWHIIALVLIVFITFHYALQCDFVNWDDDEYIVNNELIKQNDLQSIIQIFTSNYLLNYQPITLLFYKITYLLFNLNASAFHLLNIILHIINSILIYRLIRLLFNNNLLAFLSTLLWAIHPMQVESVVWLSEMKNLLFVLFGLLSIISFHKYILSKSNKDLSISLIFYLLSVLSKGTGVTIPLVFVLIIFLKQDNWRHYIKPLFLFFTLSLFFGIITFYSQSGAVNISIVKKDFFLNFFIASNGLLFYIAKLLLPFNLSTFYPYPTNYSASNLEFYYFLSPIIVIISIFLIYQYFRKIPLIVFGSLFYVLNILPVLQIIPVGNAVAADRYFYFPSIGLFIIFAWLILKLIEKKATFGYFLITLFTLFFAFKSYTRTIIWKNSITLFTEIINNKPVYPGAEINYINRGKAFEDGNNNIEALNDYNRAIQVRNNYAEAYFNIGNIYKKESQFDNALKYYDFAIKHKANYYEAFNNKGIIYLSINKPNEAFANFKQSININPEYIDPYNNIANIYIDHFKQMDTALIFINKSLEINPNNAKSYQIRARIYNNLNQLSLALNDCNKAFNLDPNDNLSLIISTDIKFKNKNFKGALTDCNKAISLNPADLLPLFSRAIILLNMGDTSSACYDLSNLANKGFSIPQKYSGICK